MAEPPVFTVATQSSRQIELQLPLNKHNLMIFVHFLNFVSSISQKY